MDPEQLKKNFEEQIATTVKQIGELETNLAKAKEYKIKLEGGLETIGLLSGEGQEETTNYIPIPSHVTGISKVFGLVSNSIRSNLFGIEYQMFLNDLYAFGSLDILNYYMTKQYLETLDMVLNNGSFQQFRFTARRDRLYMDLDKDFLKKESNILIECHRMIDPNDATEMYNDLFVKRYATALLKKQWGQNLIKYNNVQLPGGITLNGRELYTDALAEIEKIESEVLSKYAIPPMDMIG